jgi:hypothetical protein
MDRRGNYQSYIVTEQCDSCQITRQHNGMTVQAAPVQG